MSPPSAKLNQRPFHAWANLPEGWTLITDAQASAGQLAPFKEANVEIILAG
ncbi:hypothetical protein [Glutamicibacter sp. NPDC127525]|uniref:hypothetical protein n=1 Tax=unclassified Glutamicibacter TaxID=2627139 RepID=UPI00362F9BBC